MSDPINELEQDANAAKEAVTSSVDKLQAFAASMTGKWFGVLPYARAHAIVVKEIATAACFVLLALLLWRAL